MRATRTEHVRGSRNTATDLLSRTRGQAGGDYRLLMFEKRIRSYIRHLGAMNYSPATIRNRYFNIMAFARWLLANYEIDQPEDITSRHLRAWQKHIASRKTLKDELIAARTINKYIVAIRHFLKSLKLPKRREKALKNALQLLREPKLLPNGFLTHRQVRRILNSIETVTVTGIRTRTILETLYSTGIRASELLGLDLGDIDLRSRSLVAFGKGRKERVVPLGAVATEWLSHYLAQSRPELLKGRDEEAVFIDDMGNRMPYYTLRRIVSFTGRSAGVKDPVTAHVFRRTCTTELLRAGAGVYHLKELLGHEKLDTLQHYARLSIRDLKKTQRRFHPRERDTDSMVSKDPQQCEFTELLCGKGRK